MRKMTLGLFAMSLLTQPSLLLSQQQQSTQTSPTPADPTRNNPDVPKQKPNTNNPDIAPQNQPAPGGTGATTKKSRRKHRSKSLTTSSSTGS
jgi:hypothetical protein